MDIKKDLFNRFTSLIVIMILLFSLITIRLTYIQIVSAESYQQKADTKGTTEIQEQAPRGDIKDKNGVVLAQSKQSYTLTFTETDESKLYFYHTMDKIFKILDETKGIQKDDFDLKVDPFSFKFNGDSDDAKKQLELRFKKDRGLGDVAKNKLFPKKDKNELTSADNNIINSEILKKSPKETFEYLVKKYRITAEDILKNYADLYKIKPDAALEIIKSDYKITSEAEVKKLLEEYKPDSKNSDTILAELGKKCNISQKALTTAQQRRYMLVKDALKMQSYSGPKPITISNDITKDTAFFISQQLTDLPGIDITMQPIREYPFRELASGVLGYMSKIGSNQDKYEENGYDVRTDYVGVSGIESAFEDDLKGSKGTKVVKINSAGRITEELGTKDPYAGNTIKLTIDSTVQYAAEVALTKTMKDLQAQGKHGDVDSSNATRGAAVAIDVNTGAILALASNPGFDPNDFINPAGLSNNLFQKYFQPDLEAFGKSKNYSQSKIDKLFPVDTNTGLRKDKYDILPKPLFNYATSSLTPPGSTFKPLTAIAGLETGVITKNYKYNDTGSFNDGKGYNNTFEDEKANGSVDLTAALAHSSNPYFMNVGQKLREKFGDDILAKYAWKFGLGVDPTSKTKGTTGIEISEKFGQAYNIYSSKESYASSYLFTTMNTLKSGKGSRGNTFTPIELHLNGDEDDDVKDARQKIRDLIQDSIKNGNRNKNHNTYIDLVTKLIKVDDLYNGKNISKNEIKKIVSEIEYIAIDTAHRQITTGSNIYNASIGQGAHQFTPLQLANYIATIVNGGKRYNVHLVDEIIAPDGKVVKKTVPEVVEDTGIKQSTIDAVKEGMEKVVTGGTADGKFTDFPIKTAGKTGTSTYQTNQDELGRTAYSLYVGYAPADKPAKIAVAVIIFDGGHGNSSTPVAKAIYEAYFKDELATKGHTPASDINLKPINND